MLGSPSSGSLSHAWSYGARALSGVPPTDSPSKVPAADATLEPVVGLAAVSRALVHHARPLQGGRLRSRAADPGDELLPSGVQRTRVPERVTAEREPRVERQLWQIARVRQLPQLEERYRVASSLERISAREQRFTESTLVDLTLRTTQSVR